MKKTLLAIAMCISSIAAIAQSTVVGSLPQFAQGTAASVQSRTQVTLDSQGNFILPVNNAPSLQTITMTPLPGSAYSAFSLSITIGPGATNITALLQAQINPPIGTYIGLPSQTSIGTNAQGYSIPGSGGGSGSVVSVATNAPLTGGPITTSGTIGCPSCLTGANNSVLSAAISAQYGLHAYGDSITFGIGATSIGTTNYTALLHSDFMWGTLTNYAVSGSNVQDESNAVFTNETTAVSANPIFTLMIGTNNSGAITNPGNAADYSANYYGAITWLTLANVNKIAANSTTVTLTGTWASDTTYSTITGQSSTTNGSTISFPFIAENTSVYLWYRSFQSSGGTFGCTIDGITAVDTISNLSLLASQGQGFPTGGSGGTYSVKAARFLTTVGSHTLLCTVASSTGGSNNVVILGIGIPPEKRYRGRNGPNVYAAGIIFENNDANSALTAAVNALNQVASQQVIADGLNVHYVDVRQYINSTIDMTGTATQNCPASTAAGFHPNDCGHRQIANAFEDAMNPGTDVIAAPNVVAPINYTSNIAPSTLQSGFPQILPHGYGDALIGGLQLCSGITCGIKEINNPGTAVHNGFGWINYVQSGRRRWECWMVNGGITSDSQFNCPIEFLEDGGLLGNYVLLPLTTPASSSATCTAGQQVYDANFIYICVAANTWKRSALVTF